jgi:hypothetical protein
MNRTDGFFVYFGWGRTEVRIAKPDFERAVRTSKRTLCTVCTPRPVRTRPEQVLIVSRDEHDTIVRNRAR